MNLKRAIIASCILFLFPAVRAMAENSESSWTETASIKYFGICDGSAAIRIDGTTLLVANDETNIVHSFDIWGGAPIASFDLGNLLSLDLEEPEIDFEAIAKHGNRLWWIGSHSRSKKGKKRVSRRVFFATNVPSRDLSDMRIVSRQYDMLPVLLAHPDLSEILTNEILKTAPKEGGLNIEGMSVRPNGSIMLGFRAPLSQPGGTTGHALIAEIFPEDESWSVSSVSQLQLNDRGIRDMVWSNDGLIISSGPVSSNGSFSFFSWDGQGSPEPFGIPTNHDLHPEALVQVGSNWLVMSDDGSQARQSENGDVKDCKDIFEEGEVDNVFFRARMLSRR
ncbi:DUF3616 domain-containing protein [Cribrihabitans neustonicus]|uniref:DUF3616 domain-containing protein n=1 Tax=Cribrihabitans neustonicus TaxID=1429085 RepID=UPI003B5C3630